MKPLAAVQLPELTVWPAASGTLMSTSVIPALPDGSESEIALVIAVLIVEYGYVKLAPN
jgi:hypothetical protein